MAPRLKHVALVMSLKRRFDRKVIEGVTRFVRENGRWTVFLEDDPWAKVPDFDHGYFDGVIADLDDPRITKHLARLDLPVVGVGGIRSDYSWGLKMPTVNTNNKQIAILAAEHLQERHLRNFAFYGTPSRTIDPWMCERRDAFVEHLKQHGHPCHLYTVRGNSTQSWEGLQERLADWLEKLPKPVGLMAANDALARHVLEACRGIGIRVPDKVAVIGVDNDELICNLASPPLTSIVQGTEEIGYQSAVVLEGMMRCRKRKPIHIVVDPVTVLTRESTDLVATEDPVVSAALTYISQHACERIGVEDVARAADVSRSTLDARFRLVVGRTVHAEIRRVRIGAVRELLVSTELPLDQVAQRTGFGNAQYLHAVFRKALGQTPGQYRRRAK